jgi:hypothetical protein
MLTTLILLTAAVTAPVEIDYTAARARADAQEAALSPAMQRALRDAQQKRVDRALDICESDGRPKPFNIVLELDANGRTVRQWRDSDTVLAKCFEAQVSAQPFFVPEQAPFFTYFEFTFTP